MKREKRKGKRKKGKEKEGLNKGKKKWPARKIQPMAGLARPLLSLFLIVLPFSPGGLIVTMCPILVPLNKSKTVSVAFTSHKGLTEGALGCFCHTPKSASIGYHSISPNKECWNIW